MKVSVKLEKEIKARLKTANGKRRERILSYDKLISEIEDQIEKVKCKKKYYKYLVIENNNSISNSYKYSTLYTHYKVRLNSRLNINNIEIEEKYCNKRSGNGYYSVMHYFDSSFLDSVSDKKKYEIIHDTIKIGG